MRAALKSPHAIIEENIFDHLGKMNFHDSYLAFFSSSLLENGTNTTLEEYFFSNKANIEASAPGKEPPWMLTRFLGDLLHPLIHYGYGLEFGLFGQLAEGLAQAAVHPADGILLPVCIIQ
ncbi:hypothetical protein A0H81_07053 [Grifola frondosa]|uniref:Uncharacterized protein n=1 Tax=Grifola frondosa TaxID=5627 RepID=A0A1C7M8Q4_GRIFR|nr:hypothetical protein A0H81_07053 [Grifola frondosa]